MGAGAKEIGEKIYSLISRLTHFWHLMKGLHFWKVSVLATANEAIKSLKVLLATRSIKFGLV